MLRWYNSVLTPAITLWRSNKFWLKKWRYQKGQALGLNVQFSLRQTLNTLQLFSCHPTSLKKAIHTGRSCSFQSSWNTASGPLTWWSDIRSLGLKYVLDWTTFLDVIKNQGNHSSQSWFISLQYDRNKHFKVWWNLSRAPWLWGW